MIWGDLAMLVVVMVDMLVRLNGLDRRAKTNNSHSGGSSVKFLFFNIIKLFKGFFISFLFR